MTSNGDLPVFVKWMDFMKWLLITTDKFPKSARYNYTNRIVNLAFDILEQLIEARYSKSKLANLKKVNLQIEKLRILLRISFESRHLSHKVYEQAVFSLNEIGRMVGGWIKQQEGAK